jgi:hypothetical protein
MIVVVDYNKPKMKKIRRTLDIRFTAPMRLPPRNARTSS